MNYGSKTNAEGEIVRADGAAQIMAGPRVPGNTILSFGLAKNQEGETIENRAEIKFKQSNGAVFSQSFFDSEEDWAIEATNRTLLHICTKIVTEEEYYAAVAGSQNFLEFVNNIATKIIPKAADLKFNLKITYKYNKKNGKWYPNFPNFPSFVEREGEVDSKFSTNPKYDFYVIPEVEEEAPAATGEAGAAAPF